MNPVINTHTGLAFDLARPDPGVVRIDDIAWALSKLCRFTGHCDEFYSVAQHSVLVSLEVPPEFALFALLHDAHEAYTGDISAPLKALLRDGLEAPYSDYDRICDNVQRAIHLALPVPPDQRNYHKINGSYVGPGDKYEEAKSFTKHADQRVLISEKRYLMTNVKEHWYLGNPGELVYTDDPSVQDSNLLILPDPIIGGGHKWARFVFLRRYYELIGDNEQLIACDGMIDELRKAAK